MNRIAIVTEAARHHISTVQPKERIEISVYGRREERKAHATLPVLHFRVRWLVLAVKALIKNPLGISEGV